MELSERLKNLREDRGITQKELAEFLGYKASSISNYESGHRAPDIPKIIQFAEYFNVTADYLLGISEHNLTPTKMEEPFSGEITAGEFMDRLLKLGSESRDLFVEILLRVEAYEAIQNVGKK